MTNNKMMVIITVILIGIILITGCVDDSYDAYSNASPEQQRAFHDAMNGTNKSHDIMDAEYTAVRVGYAASFAGVI